MSDTIFYIARMTGTVAFAVSGSMTAIKKKVDLFGVIFLGCVTACGGGMLKDMILGIFPPSCLVNPLRLKIAIGVSALIFCIAWIGKERYLQHADRIRRICNVFDAIGLGAFAVTGAQTAIQVGYGDNGFLVVTMGFVTGAGGGLLRDTIMGEMPSVLHHRIYAVAAIVGATIFYLITCHGGNSVLAIFLGSGSTFLVRMLATIYRWDLPRAID